MVIFNCSHSVPTFLIRKRRSTDISRILHVRYLPPQKPSAQLLAQYYCSAIKHTTIEIKGIADSSTAAVITTAAAAPCCGDAGEQY